MSGYSKKIAKETVKYEKGVKEKPGVKHGRRIEGWPWDSKGLIRGSNWVSHIPW